MLNYKNILKPILTIVFLLSYTFHFYAQKKISVGDYAPTLVLSSSKNSVTTFNFQHNKLTYMYFWSSDNQESKDNMYAVKKLYKQYSKTEFKLIDGFEIALIALQADRTEWNDDIQKQGIESYHNYIATKGVKDYFLTNYEIKEIPYSFLIDEFGKIALINPTITNVKAFIDSKIKSVPFVVRPNEIKGKITHGNTIKQALPLQKIYLTNQQKDTLKTVLTNKSGEFTISGIEKNSDLTLKMPTNKIVKDDEKVYLEDENGDIVSDFNKTDNGYEYQLTEEDLQDLKSLKLQLNTEKNIVLNESLFASGQNNLTPLSEKKIDLIIEKLKTQKKLRVEIISHTDYRGDANFNQELSIKRSNSIAHYLQKKGIEKNRLKAIGKGETEPINDCSEVNQCSTQQIDLNRRTEFKFYETE